MTDLRGALHICKKSAADISSSSYDLLLPKIEMQRNIRPISYVRVRVRQRAIFYSQKERSGLPLRGEINTFPGNSKELDYIPAHEEEEKKI